MEKNINTVNAINTAWDENKYVALGICFGSGLGIFVGALFNNVMLGLSAGGVLGIIYGVTIGMLKESKKKTEK
ncbi:MAG: glycine zipper family protein [Clostridiales bacterium]|nr:glycine zipper family protein [Clostridiales bacterium]